MLLLDGDFLPLLFKQTTKLRNRYENLTLSKTTLITTVPQNPKTVVCQTRNLTKVYDLGEVQIQTLRAVDRELRW